MTFYFGKALTKEDHNAIKDAIAFGEVSDPSLRLHYSAGKKLMTLTGVNDNTFDIAEQLISDMINQVFTYQQVRGE